jgi:SAM-dependent methyltransferase
MSRQDEYDKFEADPTRATTLWQGEQGETWAERNPVAVEDTDESWMRRYGFPKSRVMEEALRDVPRETSWLEIGCSAGAHLRVLRSLGFENLAGVDVNDAGFDLASKMGPVQVAEGKDLPFEDRSFGGVTTSGSLMHCGPTPNIRDTFIEMMRVADRYIFLIELWNDPATVIMFGELLPPAWTLPWEKGLRPLALQHGWDFVGSTVLDLLPSHLPKRAPICVALLERKE